MIAAADLERRLADLEPIGLDERGTTRLAWTAEDAAAGAWFARRAAEVGLRVEVDPAGNRWALPDAPGPWWGVGSHLDSVRAGGRYDGALGVCAAFAVAEHAPVAVIAFADEEGARFNTPTFGSRALAGVLDPAVLDRRDDDGVRLADAMAAADVDPAGVAEAPSWLGRLRGFLELHVDQTPDLERFAVVRALAARMRVQADLHGRADHAGTTRPHERSDALLRAAILIVAAHQRATEDMVVTASRILVEPNALTTIAAARAPVARRALGEPVGAHGLVPGPPRRRRADGGVALGRRRVRPRAARRARRRRRRDVLRRPRCGHPGHEDPRGHGPHAQPQRHQPLPRGGRRPRRRRRGGHRDPRGRAMRAATVAAMPNAHSHAFQRDLRGLGERNPDDFWSWRTQMMHLAQALDPESMQRVATQVYGEMLAAGYGAVGEFHYVHHQADGTPYDDPNALALAVARAAIEAGLRIVAHPRRLPPRRASALPRPRRRELPGARRRVTRMGRRA